MKEKSFEPGRDNVVLIGMPGAGKSTLGIVLAKILCMDFVDADLLIQQSCDKSLQRLIDTLGPDAFIEIENQVLSEMSFEHSVIATAARPSTATRPWSTSARSAALCTSRSTSTS